ncbi:hypothetical protein JHK87_043223 [Glycine soja]|nr:hypothetical protein JHK87_043223 [Glycine soja]
MSDGILDYSSTSVLVEGVLLVDEEVGHGGGRGGDFLALAELLQLGSLLLGGLFADLGLRRCCGGGGGGEALEKTRRRVRHRNQTHGGFKVYEPLKKRKLYEPLPVPPPSLPRIFSRSGGTRMKFEACKKATSGLSVACFGKTLAPPCLNSNKVISLSSLLPETLNSKYGSRVPLLLVNKDDIHDSSLKDEGKTPYLYVEVDFKEILPDDAFGQQMTRNLETSVAWDMLRVYNDFIDAQERHRIERLEMFDEFEEWYVM